MFDIMHLLEQQTAGRVKSSDMCPISTGHTLCCFYGSFMRESKDKVKSTLTEATKNAGVSCCETTSCCGESMEPADILEVIRKDRDFVLNKWDLPEKPQEQSCCCCSEPAEEQSCCCSEAAEEQSCCCCSETDKEPIMDLDEFLIHVKSNMFTLSGMAFMDGSNLDAERLKRCRVQVLSDDDKLIPFCGYNTIYRKE